MFMRSRDGNPPGSLAFHAALGSLINIMHFAYIYVTG